MVVSVSHNEPVKVSVVIPLYNGEKFISDTLKSVLGQTFKNREIIVVDDGSTDRSSEVVMKFNTSVKLHSCINGGVAKARNFGISLASGKYIALLDHDDLWEPSKLEKQIRILDENPEIGMVVTDIIHVDTQGNPIGKYAFGYNERDEFYRLFVRSCVPTPSSAMIRKSVLENIGCFDERFGQAGMDDHELWARIGSSYPIAVVKEGLTYHRKSRAKPSRIGIEHRMLLNQLLLDRFGDNPKKKKYLMKERAAFLNDFGKQLIGDGYMVEGRRKLKESMALCMKENCCLKVLFRSFFRFLRSYATYLNVVES